MQKDHHQDRNAFNNVGLLFCHNMYSPFFLISTYISICWIVRTKCREGLHALPRKMIQPLKNVTTAALKHHHRLEKSVEHYLWKGMKPFPALTPLLHGKSRMQPFAPPWLFVRGSGGG